MENANNSNTLLEKSKSMTLKGYYNRLPEPTFPKKDFVKEVADKCNVTQTTARNWIRYGIKPNDPEHIRILSQITGISPENLWNY